VGEEEARWKQRRKRGVGNGGGGERESGRGGAMATPERRPADPADAHHGSALPCPIKTRSRERGQTREREMAPSVWGDGPRVGADLSLQI